MSNVIKNLLGKGLKINKEVNVSPIGKQAPLPKYIQPKVPKAKYITPKKMR